MYRRAKVFRHIQVLTALLNGIQKGPTILVMQSAFVVIGGLALSILVENLDLGVAFVSIALLLTVNCFMDILIILGQMARVNQKSNGLIRTMRVRQSAIGTSPQDRKWEKRFYRSCSALKIMIGSVNFVDELTPLNCFQCSISLAINLLLLNDSKN